MLRDVIQSDTLEVFHEATQDGTQEAVFVLLSKSKYQEYAATIEAYVAQNPVDDVSQQSLTYFQTHRSDDYVVLLGRLQKDMIFIDQDIKLIEANVQNELSKKLTGEVIDLSKNCETYFDKYTYRVGAVTTGTVALATEAIQKTVTQLKDKKPQEILDIGSQKLSSAISGFRQKLKSKIKP